MKRKGTSEKRLNILEIILLIGLAMWLTAGTAALRAQDSLADKVVRLHVIANSDSPADQALKLKVRDAVTEVTTGLLEGTSDREEAETLLRGSLPELEKRAKQEIHAGGFDYSVRAELACTEFPTREYDGFTIPAGEYLALRILIGEGTGQNWWCVVFPPLCVSTVTDIPSAALSAGFAQEEVRLICEEPGYVLKLKTVEFWETLRQKLT